METSFEPFTLKNKTILVTGASSGIGRQCAIDCSRMGAKVVLIARNQCRIEETLSMMYANGHKAYQFDLNSLEDIKGLIQTIYNDVGKIDGFIHAAGIEKTAPLKYLSSDDYERVFRTNCLSAFEIVKNISSIKYFNPGGSIVLISSISGVIARNGLAAYSASKGALISAMRVMASELAHRSIRVNTVSPGTIKTPMMLSFLNSLSEEEQQKRISGFPLGLGLPSDVSYTCLFLLSDASRWITGQNIIVDGGYTAL